MGGETPLGTLLCKPAGTSEIPWQNVLAKLTAWRFFSSGTRVLAFALEIDRKPDFLHSRAHADTPWVAETTKQCLKIPQNGLRLSLERAGKISPGNWGALRAHCWLPLQEQPANETSVACTGNTEASRRERPHWGQKTLLKATDQARSKNEATQIPASMRHRTLEISSVRSQQNLSAAKAGGQQCGSSHKC